MTTETRPGHALDLGGVSVRSLSGGGLWLDGGAMFGIIPKPLWTRLTSADEQNRIQLACNCLLIEPADGQRRILVETGHGPKFGEKERQIFAIDSSRWIGAALAAQGVDPASITDVVLTHLHLDHAGGLSRLEGDTLKRTFPDAPVHVQRQEYEDARNGYGIMTWSYREENLGPIDADAAWRLVEGEVEILPGVFGIPTPGHTRGHQSILIRGTNRSLLLPGDVIPTTAHLRPPYNMAYDLLPVENRESKRRILARAAAEDWRLVFGHDPRSGLLRVEPEKDWFQLVPAEI